MKKYYIWQNTDLNIEEWRAGYMDFCDINNITPGDDSALYEWMIDTNNYYFDDERVNLDEQIYGTIICISDIGRWDGRKQGYRILNDNLSSILNVVDDYIEYFGDGKNICATGSHHDGTNYYIFRAIRPGRNIDKFLNDIYNGEQITVAKLNYYTRSIYPDIARVYGWEVK